MGKFVTFYIGELLIKLWQLAAASQTFVGENVNYLDNVTCFNNYFNINENLLWGIILYFHSMITSL